MDVVLDTMGGKILEKSFKVIKPHGWVISISGAPDYRTAVDMNLNFLKKIALGLYGLPVNLLAKKANANYRFIFVEADGAQLSQISELVSNKFIRPVLDREFSLSDVQSGIEYSESGKARGKIIINIAAN